MLQAATAGEEPAERRAATTSARTGSSSARTSKALIPQVPLPSAHHLFLHSLPLPPSRAPTRARCGLPDLRPPAPTGAV
ncbi:hypothetical protein BRADI_1g19427v3 [Brachypodium distachyon]|uniref:Uncharacterized protein n=1 Tax=Brachypodium distachyon TaxID=15368 RepID=A0A2K2DK47_BRADI|nr:hypothetical protein BRADI_1g19427v3 [Brachypodium distachyon]